MSELNQAESLTKRDHLPDVREKARWRHTGVGENTAWVEWEWAVGGGSGGGGRSKTAFFILEWELGGRHS